MSNNTVTINGTVYDKMTGLPIRSAETAPKASYSHAGSVHHRIQKSTTLNRSYVKRDEHLVAKKAAQAQTHAQTVTVRRSPMISKYAPHPSQPATAPSATPDIAPTAHPITVRAAARQPRPAQRTHFDIQPAFTPVTSQSATRTHKPSDIIKAEAAAKALADAPRHQRAPHRDKHAARTRKQRASRAFSLATSGAALLLIAGYFTYINMPNLSVRVAAVQSGVDASYPGYRPSGYSLSSPVSYNNGEVQLAFANNGTNQHFTISQAKSGWDSSAVLDNYVQPKAGSDYTTTTEGGLTIYSWGGNAAWVSGGVLYTVDGDAPLSPDQIHRIAASM